MKANSFYLLFAGVVVSLSGCTVAPAHPGGYYGHDRDYGRYDRRDYRSEQLSTGAVRGAVRSAEDLRSEVLNSVPSGGERKSGTWDNRVRAGSSTNGGEHADFELSGRSGGTLR